MRFVEPINAQALKYIKTLKFKKNYTYNANKSTGKT